MSIKSEAAEKPSELPYPKLMKFPPSNLIVLITEIDEETGFGIGFVVVGGDVGQSRIGQHKSDWNLQRFIDYHGTVTLSNDTDES